MHTRTHNTHLMQCAACRMPPSPHPHTRALRAAHPQAPWASLARCTPAGTMGLTCTLHTCRHHGPHLHATHLQAPWASKATCLVRRSWSSWCTRWRQPRGRSRGQGQAAHAYATSCLWCVRYAREGRGSLGPAECMRAWERGAVHAYGQAGGRVHACECLLETAHASQQGQEQNRNKMV